MNEEVWKDVKNYDGLYQVSNLGNVKSLNRKGTKGGLIKQDLRKDGYLQVHLTKNRKMKNYLVHRLVAEAFISNLNNLEEINHKDENKQNNKLDNLEFCTRKYNMNYGTRPYKNAKKVCQTDLNNNIIKIWNSIREASRNTNINSSHISKCCKGLLRTSGGYIWRYSNGE